jgi:hypothetical protein
MNNDIRPGANRTPADVGRGYYDRSTVAYLATVRWRDWDELLEWLRSEGLNDPHLNSEEVRGVRQDAERASRRDAPFTNSVDELWAELHR